MHSIFNRRVLPRAACAASLMLAACNDGNTMGNASAAPAGVGKQASYMLVTRTRPENPEVYLKTIRAAYAFCAEVARHTGLEVSPFPTVPADYLQERTVYASDGKRHMLRRIRDDIDIRKMSPEHGCKASLSNTWSTGLTIGDRERTGERDIDGQVHFGELPVNPEEAVRPSLLAIHTQPKRVNGVPLKCSAEGGCIVDPAVVVVKLGYSPVTAAMRVENMPLYGTVITEPVSLTVGTPLDPAVFSVEKGD